MCCLVDERRHDLLRHVCEDGECRDDDEVDETCEDRNVYPLSAAKVCSVNARVTELHFETLAQRHLLI